MASLDAKTRLAIELVLRDLATKDLKRFDALVQKTTKTGRTGFLGMTGSITGMIGRLSLLTGGMVGFALAVRRVSGGFRDFFNFADAMSEVNTIFHGTNQELKEASKNVRELSLSLGLDEITVAKGLYQTLSSGISDTAEAYRVLKISTELGVAGVASTAQSVNLLTTQLNAFGLELNNRTLVSLADLNFKAVELGKTTIPELAASMGKAAPFAAQLNVPLTEVLAVIDTLSIGGINTAEAFTGLRQVLKSLLQPSKDASKEFFKLFEGQTPSAILKTEGLVGVLQRLEDEYKGNEEALTKLFTNVRAVTPILAITGKQADKFREILDQLQNSAGAFGLALDKSMLSPGRRLKIILTGINQGFEDLAETMIEVFSPGIADIQEIRAEAQGWKEDIVALAIPIRAVGAAIAVWLAGVKAVATGLGFIANSVGLMNDVELDELKNDLLGVTELTLRLAGISDESNARTIATNREVQRQALIRNLATERAMELSIQLRRINAEAASSFQEDFQKKIIRTIKDFQDAMELAGEDGSAMFMELQISLGMVGETVVEVGKKTDEGAKTFFDGWNKGWEEIQKTLTSEALGEEAAFQMFGALESGLDTFSRDLVQGKADFGEFAKSLIQDLTAIAIKMLILKAISSFLPGFEKGGTVTDSVIDNGTNLALGGVMSGKRMGGNLPLKAYATGGIADRPQLAVFGEGNSAGGEAFVPLGPSRKIGVEIRGDALPGQGPSQGVTVNLVVQSLDPRGAAEVVIGVMPDIEKALAKSLVAGRTRALTTAVRSVARGGI